VLFNTPIFVVFFVWFFVMFHFVARTKDQKLWLLTVGSLIFYGAWNARFVALLVATGLADFYLAQMIHVERRQARKRLLLALSVTMNLGVLAVFKYANFFLENVQSVLSVTGTKLAWKPLDIVLPVGISFYTFQAISYTTDVYRGVFQPRRRVHEFIAALTFFPHLVAGPIVRSSYLLPQFENLAPPAWTWVKRGFLLIATGMLKKSIADLLARAVDPAFAAGPDNYLDSWTGALAFSGQVYGDFSGYTDIATGIALLLGFTLPPNFELPYLSHSPVEFWHRWHISLSTWLRDYLWLPLSLALPGHSALNLLITMLLAGLWHGANWTFVAWGLFHGVLLVITHAIAKWAPNTVGEARSRLPWALRAGQVIFTFYLVTIGWVMFRSPTFTSMFSFLRAMHLPTGSSSWCYEDVMTLVLVVVGLVATILLSALKNVAFERGWRKNVFWPLVVLVLGVAIALGRRGQAFIYFQF
jgi:D-alanyl-lipoteichoic acid acyltransferase DltB (MBOAT superfamily)